MKRRRFLLALALAAVATGSALFLWPTGPVRQTVTLSDGSRMTLRAVMTGTNATFRSGGPFRRLAAKLPLARSQRWATESERRLFFGEQTNLALWFTSTPLAPRSGQYQFRIVDDYGTNTARFRSSSPMRIPGNDIVTCYWTPLWPRRSQHLTVQAFADVRPLPAKPEWEVRIRNPAYAEHPHWAPERFPATRTVGDTQFTLQEVPPTSMPVAEARLRIACDGQPSDDWSVCGVQFRDATGNRVQTTPGDVTRTGPGRWWVRVPNPLFAGEESARIGVGFVRRDHVPTNDTFVLRGVPVRVVTSGSLGNGPLILTNPMVGRVIVSADMILSHSHQAAPSPGAGVAERDAEGWAFVASADPLVRDIASPDARWFLVLGVQDDQGRIVSVNNTDLDGSQSRRLALPAGARMLDITVAAPRVVFLEWTVSRAQLTAVAGRP